MTSIYSPCGSIIGSMVQMPQGAEYFDSNPDTIGRWHKMTPTGWAYYNDRNMWKVYSDQQDATVEWFVPIATFQLTTN